MGATTVPPSDASIPTEGLLDDVPEGMMTVTVIAPEGESGTRTVVLTVPSKDAAITALPDLVNFPDTGRANKRDLDPRQAGEGGNVTTSVFWMPRNDTSRPEIVAVMGSANSGTASLVLMCTCAILAMAMTRDIL